MSLNKKELEEYEGKSVKIILKDGYHYNGYIISISEEHLKLADRFLGNIIIAYEEIKLLRENKGGTNE